MCGICAINAHCYHYSHPTPQKGGQISGQLMPVTPLVWAFLPCSPVLAKTGAGGKGICPGLLQSGQGLEDGSQAGRAQALQPGGSQTPHL